MADRPLFSWCGFRKCSAIARSILFSLGTLAGLGAPVELDAAGPGDWTPDKDWKGTGGNQGRYAIHLALLPGDGNPHHSRILWYGGEHHSEFHGGQWGWRPGAEGCTSYPDTSYIKDLGEVAPSGMNPFCGAATLIDNRLLTVGGTTEETDAFGERQTRLFTPGAATAYGSWSDPGSMAAWRWYPTTVHLRDAGRVMVVAGSQHVAHKMFGMVKDGANQSSPDADLLRRQQPMPFGTWDDPVLPAAFTTDKPRPSPRVGHSMVEMTGVAGLSGDVIFGGRDASGNPQNDLWRLLAYANHLGKNPQPWWFNTVPVSPTSGPPAPRSDHTMIRTPNPLRPLILFGGLGDDDTLLNDVWRLFKQPTTSAVEFDLMQISGIPPLERYGHTAIYDATVDTAGILLERMIVFGGATSTSADPNDLKVYELRFSQTNPNAAAWNEMVVVPIGSWPQPAPRLWHTLVADSSKLDLSSASIDDAHTAILFGGKRTSSLYSDSLWALWIMKNGRVGWELRATSSDGYAPAPRARHSAVWDAKNVQAPVGRLYIYGGEDDSGPADSYLYVIDTWDQANPDWQRWADRGFTLSGHKATLGFGPENARIPEIYDHNASGNRWSSADSATMNQSSYPVVFMVPGAPDGKSRVISLHKDTLQTYRLDVPPSGSAGAWQKMANAALSTFPEAGVQYRPGKIMRAGGALKTGPKTGMTFTLDTSDLGNAWMEGDSMAPRTHHNLVLLPTGQVLAVGGNNHPSSIIDSAQQRPQLWTPNSPGSGGKWTSFSGASDTLAVQPTARTYHSTAILLPDGRVLSAGGETPVDKYVANIYCPPYLFKANGTTPAVRPSLTAVTRTITWGQTFDVCVNDTALIRRACLMRPGATTHAVDMNQSFVPITILSSTADSGRVFLQAPASSDVAPPGEYLLFLLGSADGDTVPSVAQWVRISSTAPQVPDELSLTADLITCESIGPIRWQAPTEATGGARAIEYDIRYSLSPINSENFGSATPLPGVPYPACWGASETGGSVTGLAPATMVYFAGKSKSAVGLWSNPSYAEMGTLYSCGGSGGGLSMRRAGGDPDDAPRAAETEEGSRQTAAAGANPLIRPGAAASSLSGVSTLRLVGEFAAGSSDRWRLLHVDLAGDEARLEASSQQLVLDEPTESGWCLRGSRLVSGGLAGLRDLTSAGRLIFPAGTSVEALVASPRQHAVSAARHSTLGSIALGDSAEVPIDLTPGDTLEVEFGPSTSAGNGEDCVLLVRLPGGTGATSSRRPGRGLPAAAPPTDAPVDEGLTAEALPTAFALHPARPNPFSGETTLQFDLPASARVRIELFDVQGRRVARLVDRMVEAGRHTATWSGRSEHGGTAGPGVYLCRMITGAFKAERRVTRLP